MRTEIRHDNLLRLTALLILCSPLRIQSTQTGTGTIEGRVTDEAGNPLTGAKVFAEPVAAKETTIGKLHYATTDENGRFTLQSIAPGTNLVCASKEEALYPDTCAAAMVPDLNVLPRVSVGENQTSKNVTVRLTKGAKLKGMIIDSQTGEPIVAARIRLSRSDNLSLFVSTGPDEQGRFEFVIPSKPFRIEVSSAGYKTWSSIEHGGAVLLQPGSVKDLTVQLQK